jgi:hypothetical protein
MYYYKIIKRFSWRVNKGKELEGQKEKKKKEA